MLINLFILAGGFAIGILLSVLYFFSKQKDLQTQTQNLSVSNALLTEKSDRLTNDIENYKLELNQIKSENQNLAIIKATLESQLSHQQQLNKDKIQEIEALQQKLTTEFENIANRVLKQRSEEFHLHQTQKMSDVLNPLKDKIQAFEKRVEETYDKELRDKLNLQAEVQKLFELNKRISDEANNLTRALKGDVKKMGNWGELILERVLEQSGLTKGREYDREVSSFNEVGDNVRLDVIINLPEDKKLIIDSKLSLIAYERYVNAPSDEARQLALKEHLESMRRHVKTLSEKNYHSIRNINVPEFVLMFIPVEASFAAAVEADAELFSYAWDRKIIPVSPSTLLATLRTIASIWKQENQTRNALEIARQGGALYDKLISVLTDLEKIGKSIDSLHDTYEGVMGKISTGKGNLLTRAEKIKELGAKTSKEMPIQMASLMSDEDEN